MGKKIKELKDKSGASLKKKLDPTSSLKDKLKKEKEIYEKNQSAKISKEDIQELSNHVESKSHWPQGAKFSIDYNIEQNKGKTYVNVVAGGKRGLPSDAEKKQCLQNHHYQKGINLKLENLKIMMEAK